MAKYFLGSVGRAEAFRRMENGNMQLLFSSKTLTDSGINISTSKDDIRAGEGAPIQFSFYHDPSVEITLTDVLWKREYLEAQLGVTFQQDAEHQYDYVSETLENNTSSAVSTNLGHTMGKLPVVCSNSKPYVLWGSKAGEDDWKVIASSDTAITSYEVPANTTLCVRYFGTDSRARMATITSTIIPEELFLIITAPIYAGDACAASRGKAAGHITFEVPRFQLNGAQDFTMNMSSNQTMSLSGTAMATTAEDCESSAGKLLRIIEVLENEHWYSDVIGLLVDEDSAVNGATPVVFAERKDGSVFRCDNANLLHASTDGGTATPMTAAYTWSTGTVYININDGNGGRVLDPDEEVDVRAS